MNEAKELIVYLYNTTPDEYTPGFDAYDLIIASLRQEFPQVHSKLIEEAVMSIEMSPRFLELFFVDRDALNAFILHLHKLIHMLTLRYSPDSNIFKLMLMKLMGGHQLR